ncbi:hypothetical protein ACFV5N_02300 [Streptomyces sp. NPDC059853]|uniref:hypothetical protein n=1 Tax=Streptomyces sp. NPDC059853 TaxID=3346973 RepID=UPI003666D965
MIQIALGKKKDVEPNSDSLQCSQIRWSDGLSDQQLHDISRGVWGMPGSRVERERFAVINSGVALYTRTGVASRRFPKSPRHPVL